MTAPLPTPLAGEAAWDNQTKTAVFDDEGHPTYVAVFVYYATRNNRVTRATVENTTTLHPARVVVTDRNQQIVRDERVPAPTPLRTYDLSGLNVTVRGDEDSDRFSLNLAVRG